jgi:hypothetical protein
MSARLDQAVDDDYILLDPKGVEEQRLGAERRSG